MEGAPSVTPVTTFVYKEEIIKISKDIKYLISGKSVRPWRFKNVKKISLVYYSNSNGRMKNNILII